MNTDGLRRKALVGGGLLLALTGLGAIGAPESFFRAYLVAFLFWSGIALGALAVLCLHQFVGGEWGFVSRRVLEAATRTVPWLVVFFVPVAAGMKTLYPWASDGAESRAYLNVSFFLSRAALYFGVWIFLARRLNALSRAQDEGERYWVNRLQITGAVGMLAYGLTITFASVDWVMSLEPEWYSTMYGLLFMVGQVLAALAFVVPVLSRCSRAEPLAGRLQPSHFHDLGNLILAFVLLWAYLAFSQYLIIWSGNLPEEIPWYLHRARGGWTAIALALVLFHFALPFVLLLLRQTKRRMQILARLSIAILVARWIDLYWLVAPASRETLGIGWMDLTATLGVGGLWLGLFLREIAALPLLPRNDPRFAAPERQFGKDALEHGTG